MLMIEFFFAEENKNWTERKKKEIFFLANVKQCFRQSTLEKLKKLKDQFFLLDKLLSKQPCKKSPSDILAPATQSIFISTLRSKRTIV